MESRALLWEEVLLGMEGRPVCTVGDDLTEEELSRHKALVEAGESFYSPDSPVLSAAHMKHYLGGSSSEEYAAQEFLAFLLMNGDVFINGEGKLTISGAYGEVELTDLRRDLREIFRCCVRLQLFGVDAWIVKKLGTGFNDRDISDCIYSSKRNGYDAKPYLDGLK